MENRTEEERILYYPCAGLTVDFLHIPNFDVYTKFILIDILPEAEDWSQCQNDVWKDIYYENNTLEKLKNNLIDVFGEEVEQFEEKNMLRFKYGEQIIEYYYNTDCTTFPYIVEETNGILFNKIWFLIYNDDEFFDTMFDLGYTNQLYLMMCECGNEGCVISKNNMKECFEGVPLIEVAPEFPPDSDSDSD
jgi:hypothetical protein